MLTKEMDVKKDLPRATTPLFDYYTAVAPSQSQRQIHTSLEMHILTKKNVPQAATFTK